MSAAVAVDPAAASAPGRQRGNLLTVEHLSTTFDTPAGQVCAVRDVSFSVGRGEVVGLVGESGSGKTVTALSLLRLLPRTARTAGRIDFDGRDVLDMSSGELRELRGADIAMIFQDPMTSLDPLFTIESQIVGVIRAHQEVSRRVAADRAARLLRDVGIADVAARLKQYPHQLSGGMRQRVMIAMALANEPSLLIADEPTTALDVTIQAQIIRLLKQACARTGMSVVLVTHDLGVVAGICDRLFVMYGGRLVETGPVTDVYATPGHPYTAGLLASVIRTDRDRATRLPAIEGQPPIMLDPAPGCPFAPRCELRAERCTEQTPELTLRSPTHAAACFVTEERHARKP